MICDRWDVVVVPFPFTDRPDGKRRPALVLSGQPFNARGHSVLAMITTKADPAWPGDTRVRDLHAAGLAATCLVRLKLFTVDNRLLVRRIGGLAAADAERVERELRACILPGGRARYRRSRQREPSPGGTDE